MKKMQNSENVNKLTLDKFKIAKLDNLISIKGGALLNLDENDSEDDTWGS
ncbi:MULTISPECIES: hypothetical protein [Aquimarina]|nr:MULTISPECIES: hypothetical protein [Aquimarina]